MVCLSSSFSPTHAPSPAPVHPLPPSSNHPTLLCSILFPADDTIPSHQSRQQSFHVTPLRCLLSSHRVSPRRRGEQCKTWSLSCSRICRQAKFLSLTLPWSLSEPGGLGPDTSNPESLTGHVQVFDRVRVEGTQGSPGSSFAPTADE